MNKLILSFFGLSIALFHHLADAAICPNPSTSSLRWGEVPAPWATSPFSVQPQGDADTRFIQANVLVTNGNGKGVACTYQNSLGQYVIWWPVITKIPARNDNAWILDQGGFICTRSIAECQFYTI